MKKVLFIDRDGTLIREPPVSLQVDSLEQLEFVPGVFRYLSLIAETTDYELVMVSNQDGLGTSSFPEEQFWPAHHKMIRALANEGIHFAEEHIDRSLPGDNSPDRKPGIGMLHQYFCNEYDLANSFVIGDRATDMELAQNLGARGILFSDGAMAVTGQHMPALQTTSWKDIYTYLRFGLRKASISRKTKETDVRIQLNLDGSGLSTISTGVAFFDHMLEQISKHGMIDLDIQVAGDLQVDEHHTIEDTAIVLGQAFRAALGDKAGLNRYGFCLPMDDCLAQVALDFGGRSWLEWDATFRREMIGKVPTEMFLHFFKSFSDAAACNLNIKAEGQNEHHKIEAIFKAFAKALRMAIARDLNNMVLPTTKGTLS